MTIKITIPKTWDEIPDNTLKRIVWLLSTLNPSKKQDILIFLALQNIKFWQFAKLRKTLKVFKIVPLSELKKHYMFLFKDIELKRFIPQIKIGRTIYYAPGKRLHNITIDEFAICEDLFFQFHATNNIEFIRMLAAVLYRPKINGQKIIFDQNYLSEITDKFKDVPVPKLLTIAFSYKGSSLFIQKLYPNVFKKSDTAKAETTYKPQKPSFGKIVVDLAGGKFGNVKETKETNVHDFLSELNNLLKPKKL